jgi:hypothetical protein
MRRFQLTRLASFLPLALAGVVLLLPATAWSYVIWLKDGSRIEARDKPTVQGNKWIFVVTSGNTQSILAAEVDEKKTEEYNKLGLGDSYLLQDDKGKVLKQAPSSYKPSLSEYIKAKNKSELKAVSVAPEPAEKSGKAEKPAKAQAVAAAPSAPAGGMTIDSIITDAFLRACESAGVGRRTMTVSGGSMKLQAVADSEQQVFAAIGAAARGLKESRASGKPLEKVELVLATASGENAGRFQISPDDAEALLTGKISAARFFVANVVF